MARLVDDAASEDLADLVDPVGELEATILDMHAGLARAGRSDRSHRRSGSSAVPAASGRTYAGNGVARKRGWRRSDEHRQPPSRGPRARSARARSARPSDLMREFSRSPHRPSRSCGTSSVRRPCSTTQGRARQDAGHGGGEDIGDPHHAAENAGAVEDARRRDLAEARATARRRRGRHGGRSWRAPCRRARDDRCRRRPHWR